MDTVHLGDIRRAVLAAVFLLLARPGQAADLRDARIESLSARLFPALTALSTASPLIGNVDGTGIGKMLAERRKRMSACADIPSCLFAAAAWSKSERDLLASAAERDFNEHPSRTSPIPDDGIREEVLRELNGLNHILDVYGLGTRPHYNEIDGPGTVSGTPQFESLVGDAMALGNAVQSDSVTRLDTSIGLTLALLDASGRDDAASFEPLDARYNSLAAARVRMIDWSQYPYTAIIVPGKGPDDLATPLSAGGKLRVRLAAARFFDGVAPYIIVTGGAVHPLGTKHVEAMEMRLALIERYGVPEDSIIVEPYARHTTTNLRNATRRLAALKAPLDRDALIITDPEQSKYIEGADFGLRNRQELGYQPGVVKARLSPTELTFRPSPASLRIDPIDPLDP